MFNRIAAKAKELEDELVQWRREIHMNPELSFEERHTTDFIESKLRNSATARLSAASPLLRQD